MVCIGHCLIYGSVWKCVRWENWLYRLGGIVSIPCWKPGMPSDTPLGLQEYSFAWVGWILGGSLLLGVSTVSFTIVGFSLVVPASCDAQVKERPLLQELSSLALVTRGPFSPFSGVLRVSVGVLSFSSSLVRRSLGSSLSAIRGLFFKRFTWTITFSDAPGRLISYVRDDMRCTTTYGSNQRYWNLHGTGGERSKT